MMVSYRQRVNQLNFVLKYGYGVPEGMMDKMDIPAYADPKLEFGENLKVLMDAYPWLRKYIDDGGGLRYADEMESMYENFIEDLWYLLGEIVAGSEEAKRELELLGYTPDEAVEIIRNYLEEEAKKPIEVKKVVKKKVEKPKKTNTTARLMEEYEKYLKSIGYTGKMLEDELKYARYDVESLAKDVDSGKMTFERAIELLEEIAPPPPSPAPITIEERKGKVIPYEEIKTGEFPPTIPKNAIDVLNEEMANMPPRVKEEFIEMTKPEVLRDVLIFGFKQAKELNKIRLYFGDDYYVKVLLTMLFDKAAEKYENTNSASSAAAKDVLRRGDEILEEGVGKAFGRVWYSLYHKLPKNIKKIKRRDGKGYYLKYEIIYALTLYKILKLFGLNIPENMEDTRYILEQMGVIA